MLTHLRPIMEGKKTTQSKSEIYQADNLVPSIRLLLL